MADIDNEEMINKLAESRDNINLLQNMLKKELHDVEQKLQLVGEAKRNINDVLYGLTGNKFYQNLGGI